MIFFPPGSITCKGQLSTCICWSAISKCADTGTDWHTASYQMLRDEGSCNTGSRSSHKGCATFRLPLPPFQGTLQIKKGHVNLSCLTIFFFLLHTMITWSSLVTSILYSGWNTKGKERSNTVLPEKLWSKTYKCHWVSYLKQLEGQLTTGFMGNIGYHYQF